MTATLRAPELSMQKVGWQTYRTALWRAEEPGDARPLLFFNGIGANLELIQPLADAMPERDIVTFDMPGIGGSPAPVLPYRPWMIGKAAAAILDRFGFGEVDVMGVSWGGGAAQQFALQYRKRVKRLVLCATSTGMTMIPGNFEALTKMATPRRYLDKDYLIKNFERLYGDEGDFIKRNPLKFKPPGQRGYLFQMLAMVGWTSLPFIPFLNVPTLVMAGDNDKIVPLINSRLIAKVMPNARLHVVHGGGHLFIVTRIAEILPVMKGFLDGPPPPPRSIHATRAVAI